MGNNESLQLYNQVASSNSCTTIYQGNRSHLPILYNFIITLKPEICLAPTQVNTHLQMALLIHFNRPYSLAPHTHESIRALVFFHTETTKVHGMCIVPFEYNKIYSAKWQRFSLFFFSFFLPLI